MLNRHEHGLERIIRRRSLPRNIAIYNSPTQVRDRRVELTKVLEKFKFAKFRFLILRQSSNFGLFPFWKKVREVPRKFVNKQILKDIFMILCLAASYFCISMLKSGPGTPNALPISHYFN